MKRFLVLLLLATLPSFAFSAEEGEENAEQPPLMYFPVEPKTLTFYQGTGRKIKYIVVQVEIAVKGQDNYDLVEENLPLIQDALTDYFHSLDKSMVEDLAKRRQMQEEVKKRLNEVLQEETKVAPVEEVLFTDYMYQ